jgi:hypothetical protein
MLHKMSAQKYACPLAVGEKTETDGKYIVCLGLNVLKFSRT